jgi:hypothetical protein
VTITETLMGDGRWSVQLRDDTPREVIQRLFDRYSLLKITGSHVDPETLPSVALPSYTGVRMGSDQDGEVHGVGLSWYLGAPSGEPRSGYDSNAAWDRGAWVNYTPASGAGAPTEWVTQCCRNGITLGAVGLYNGNPNMPFGVTASARRVLEVVCYWFGMEWQIGSDAKLWTATRVGLFGDPATLTKDNPDAVLLVPADSSGQDLDLPGWAVNALQFQVDDTDRVNRIISRVDGVIGTPALGNPPDDGYCAPDGTQLDLTLQTGDHTGDLPVTQAANDVLATWFERAAPATQISIQVDEYDVSGRFFRDGIRPLFPGSNVAIYDPARNIFELANPVEFRGRTIYPLRIRVVGWEWPLKQGMGVYLDNRHNTGSATPPEARVITDLTPWVVWEDGDIRLEVGQLPRKLDGTRRFNAP